MQINPDQLNFMALKDGLAQGMTFLKRRFSSGDLTGDNENPEQQQQQPQQQQQQQVQDQDQQDQSSLRPPPRPHPPRRQTVDLSSASYVPTTVSAPTSPANRIQQQTSSTTVTNSSTTNQKPSFVCHNADKCKYLLIIDDSNIAWQKYFPTPKLHGDFEVKVEQSSFQNIKTISSNVDGCFVCLSETRILKIDFVLIRQHPKDKYNDYRNIIIALMYGGVNSVNSLQSIYNFADRGLVFSHMVALSRQVGKENFPLIFQTFSFGKDRLTFSAPAKYPVIIKAGHAYNGVGKMKIINPAELLDFDSVLNLHADYATVEPYIDVMYEIIITKIGAYYKTIVGKRKSDYWKSNSNSLFAEPTATEEKYKFWIDEVCNIFGGLEACSMSILLTKNGQEFIYKVNDITMPLIGDVENDCQKIAELVLNKMNSNILSSRKSSLKQEDSADSKDSAKSQNASQKIAPQQVPSENTLDPQVPQKERRSYSQAKPLVPVPPVPIRRYSSVTDSSERQPHPSITAGVSRKLSDMTVKEEPTDDTMGNLKKTFAGLFGDM